MIYLKTAVTTAEADHQDVRDLVSVMLARIAISGEEAVRDYSRTFDKWTGDIIVSPADLKATKIVSDNIKRGSLAGFGPEVGAAEAAKVGQGLEPCRLCRQHFW